MNKLIDNDAYIPFAMAHAYAVKDGYTGTIQMFVAGLHLGYLDVCEKENIIPELFPEWIKGFR